MTTQKLHFRFLRHALSTPFILGMLVPILFADLCVEVYHRICFPLYGMKYVQRSRYIRIVDREKLPYLSFMERLWCGYCGYVNGWFHYASVIAGKTEGYFCPIEHLETRGYVPAEHGKDFVEYGDEGALRRRYAAHERRFGKVD